MKVASFNQKLQDWITQQWVIFFGTKINANDYKWLLGPFGKINGIGLKFIEQLSENEQLIIDDAQTNKGLLQSINQLELTSIELNKLSKNVIDFYENTSNYNFELKVKWNPIFKIFGVLLNEDSNTLKRIIWLRKFKQSGQVVYSGVYETCLIPNGQKCIKAIFPLPNGSATVILTPTVGENGELILNSSGNKIGDSGFYFLLKDARGNLWTKFIRSFKDKLVVSSENGKLKALQTLTMWNLRVLQFSYTIHANN